MTKNYLLVAFRSLQRRAGSTAINVLGLAVGLACFFLIGLYVRDELAVDRFHEDLDQLYAVGAVQTWSGETHRQFALPLPTGGLLADYAPEVEHACRVRRSLSTVWASETAFTGEEQRYADPSFFDLFTFPALAGDVATALDAPSQVVLSAEAALRYFGTVQAVGETLDTRVMGDRGTLTVAAVVEIPRTSSFTFDVLISGLALEDDVNQWGTWTGITFLKTQPGVTTATLADVFDRFTADVIAERNDRLSLVPIPLADVYFSDFQYHTGLRGDTRYLLLFGSVALLVLLIALVNYTNLATAQATDRAREVGVRKAVGAQRGQLARQFLGEALLVSLAAYGLAVVLVTLAIPGFNAILGTSLAAAALVEGPTLLWMLAAALLAAALAGAYPAFLLARQQPTAVLRGTTTVNGSSGLGGVRLRKGLVVGQFAITVALLVGVTGIVQQLRYVQTTNLGFDREQVLALSLGGPTAEQAEAIKATFAQHPAVRSASATSAAPGAYGMMYSTRDVEGRPDPEEGERPTMLWTVFADHDYAATLSLNVVAGRFFDPAMPTDVETGVVLNEAAARELGWVAGDAPLSDALGKTLNFVAEGTVIGVVEDFHYDSMRDAIEPLGFRLGNPSPDTDWPDYYTLLLKLDTQDLLATMDDFEAQWAALAGDTPFEATFVDEYYEAMYRDEVRLGRLLGTFAGLAIFVACLGLVGLAAYTAQRRTKEIGVRKVLGA
ncbi:MAG: ABC transporter permease, partial [Bacteroidota bacterium]